VESPHDKQNITTIIMNLTGILKVKKDEEAVNDKFKKREFVVTDNSSQYPQHISFQLTQAKCELLDSFQVGQEITVHFNIRGREWVSPSGEVKYFNSLEAWKLEGSSNAMPPARNAAVNDEGSNITDDLPF
jgi:hypothetical protein